MQEAGQLDGLIADRYASWKAKGGLGQKIINGKVRPVTAAWMVSQLRCSCATTSAAAIICAIAAFSASNIACACHIASAAFSACGISMHVMHLRLLQVGSAKLEKYALSNSDWLVHHIQPPVLEKLRMLSTCGKCRWALLSWRSTRCPTPTPGPPWPAYMQPPVLLPTLFCVPAAGGLC